METLKTLLQNRYAQLVAVFLLGGIIGVTFYPTKNIEEKTRQVLDQQYSSKIEEINKKHSEETKELSEKLSLEQSSHRQYQEETSKKVQTLTVENTQLKQSMKKRKFKLVKPDGTIVETEVEESNTEKTTSMVTQIKSEFTRKVQEIEDKWKKLHEERVASLKKTSDEQISKLQTENKSLHSELETSKSVQVNPKKLRPEIGVTTRKDIYVHGTYSVFGPVFLGAGVSGSTDKQFGEGRFGLGIEF